MGAPLARLTAQVAVEEFVAALDEHRNTGRRHPRTVGQADGARLRQAAGEVRRHRGMRQVRKPHAVVGPRANRSNTGAPESPLAAREFEAAVRVEAKTLVADGVAALTLRELEVTPCRPGNPAHMST